MKTALITGSNSGFGMLTALELAENGYKVIATMRNLDNLHQLMNTAIERKIDENIQCAKLDVTNPEDLETVSKLIDHTYGKLDILINNAGYAQGGFIDDIRVDILKEQFNTNVFGPIQVTQAFLPYIRRNDGGKIINISSISGYFGFPGLSPYTSSKFALEGWSESLRLELRQENIWVSLVEPASYQTNIWEKGISSIEINENRTSFQKRIIEQAIHSSQSGADPLEVARLIVKICGSRKPKLRYPIGKGTKLLYMIKGIVPWGIIESIAYKKIMKRS